MDGIQVDSEGLQMLAAQYASASSELAGRAPNPPVGPAAQATSGAATSGYAALEAVAVVLAARVQATGSKLNASGNAYIDQDENSARRITAAGQSTEV